MTLSLGRTVTRTSMNPAPMTKRLSSGMLKASAAMHAGRFKSRMCCTTSGESMARMTTREQIQPMHTHQSGAGPQASIQTQTEAPMQSSAQMPASIRPPVPAQTQSAPAAAPTTAAAPAESSTQNNASNLVASFSLDTDLETAIQQVAQELARLTNEHGSEFLAVIRQQEGGLVVEIYKGDGDSVEFERPNDAIAYLHTHPSGNTDASETDMQEAARTVADSAFGSDIFFAVVDPATGAIDPYTANSK